MFLFSENTWLHITNSCKALVVGVAVVGRGCVCCSPQHLYEHSGVLPHLLLRVAWQTAARLESESETEVKGLYRMEISPIEVCARRCTRVCVYVSV